MQLIDKKGRLFGLINLIDLTVIVLVLLLAFGAYSKVTERLTPSNQEVATQDVEIDMFLKEVMIFTTNNFQVGDIIKDSVEGTVIGTVKEVKVEPFREAALDSQGNLISLDVPEKFNVTLVLEGEAQVSPQGIKIQGAEMLNGNIYTVQSHRSKAQVVMIDVRY